ncbi:aldehyde dehydrogenase domain-containing protein [Limtongia smithiae]|uniref:aldehyde dehydrogenase domain-containing protein n=1 Tax=Limtongia smithiae TaxID=1125753 RepID=UPI0034CDD169
MPTGITYEQPVGLFINNEFVASSDGAKLTTLNPATDEEITSVYSATAADVDTAITTARIAFKSWRELSGTDRGIMLLKLSDIVAANSEILGNIEAWDNGKPVSAAIAEDVTECINVLRYYGGWADKIHGETIQPFREKLAFTIVEPLGVCGLIVPWNYPIMLSVWKIAPALAAGNTVVLKSSELTPLSALFFGTLVKEAGIPPGVINIISGDGMVGAALSSSANINKVSFTGSVDVGKKIMKAASANLVPVTLELGGKSAAIVFPDADLDQAVKWCHIGIMSNMGQICTATSRIYVHEAVQEQFVKLFIEHTQSTSKIGTQFDEDTFQGPQISQRQLDKIASYVQSGVSEGATLAYGGSTVDGAGYFMQPTVFTNVKDSMRISKEEIFGPVVIVDAFKDADDAVTRANQSAYGLGAAVFSENITLALDVARRLESGMVWINSSNDSDFRVPFGGYKQSGFGRELGEQVLSHYTQKKSVHVNLGTRL